MWVTGTGHGACIYEKILNNVYILHAVKVSFLINKHKSQF